MSWNSFIDLGSPSGRAGGLCSPRVCDGESRCSGALVGHYFRLWGPVLARELFITSWEWVGYLYQILGLSTSSNPSLMWKNDSSAKDGSCMLLQWRYFISWTKARFWQGKQWDKLWTMVLAPKWNVSRLVNNQPKKYKTSFDNLNFWKQFRGQVGSFWLPRKGKVFLLRCWSLVEMPIFFQPYNMYTQCWPI